MLFEIEIENGIVLSCSTRNTPERVPCVPSGTGSTMKHKHNGIQFADNIFTCIISNKKDWIFIAIRFQLTMSQNWFRLWPDAEQTASHYRRGCWSTIVYDSETQGCPEKDDISRCGDLLSRRGDLLSHRDDLLSRLREIVISPLRIIISPIRDYIIFSYATPWLP